MVIRSAKREDISQLIWDKDLEIFKETVNQQLIESNENKLIYLVAEIDGEIIGQIEATIDQSPAYISALRVKEAYQNQDIGTRLIKAIEEELKSRGTNKVKISVGIDNENAKRLYERLGYMVTGKRNDN